MAVLVTCKNEEDPITNEGIRVLTTLYIDFSDAQGQLTPEYVVGFGRISNSSEILWSSLPARMEKSKKNAKIKNRSNQNQNLALKTKT